ncbi:MAG TPA: hypothetical protein VK175_04805 [Leadbetterella sp.]|nr:hypothetical protein [Leadbetterella sp.]
MKKILISFLLLGWLGNLSAQTIQRIEYFIDTDPGYGAGILVPFSGTSTANANLSIPLVSGLNDGIHKIYIRAKDSNGRWSMVQSQNFFKIGLESSASNITKLEYFIDTDPGFGNGIQVPVTAGLTTTQTVSVPLSANLPNGFQKLFIRAKDASGKWSVVFSQNFFKTEVTPSRPNIVRMEYFIDNDPGFDLATDIPISPGTLVSQSHTFAVPSGVTLGNHSLVVRAKDALGKWSIVANKTFTKCSGLTISAPEGVLSCNDTLKLKALRENGTGGSITWFLNNQLISNIAKDSIFATISGVYTARLNTGGACQNVSSNPLSINILGGTNLRLSSNQPNNTMYCNESTVIKIDSAISILPTGVTGAVFDWYRNDTLLFSNSNLSNMNTTVPGIFKGVMKVSSFPSGCNSFEMDSVIVQNKQLNISIGPQTSPGQLLLCNGFTASFTSNDNFQEPVQFNWFRDNQPINGAISTTLGNVSVPGVYTLRGSFDGCQNISSNALTLSFIANSNSEVPVISTLQNLNTEFCRGDTVRFTATGCSQGYKWPTGLEANGSQAFYVVSGTFNFTVTCEGACLGLSSDPKTVLSKPNSGFEPELTYALLPCSPDFTNLRMYDYSTTYGNHVYMASKPLFSGYNTFFGYTFGTLYNPSNNISEHKGSADFLITETMYGGKQHHYLGGSDADFFWGMKEIEPRKFILFGSTRSANSGDVSTASNGLEDMWAIYYDLNTSTKIWDRRFGGNNNENIADMATLANGQMLFAGSTQSVVSGNKTTSLKGLKDYIVIKTDASGNKLAEFSYGGDATNTLKSILKISENEFLLFGNSNSPVSDNKTSGNFGGQDYWAVWIDANGNILRQKTYGGDQDETARKAILLPDGHILLTGHSFSGISGNKSQASRGGAGTSDFWVLKIDNLGNIVWDKTLGSNKDEILSNARLSLENNLLLYGTTTASTQSFERQSLGPTAISPTQTRDTWLLEIDENGNRVTDKTIGHCLNDDNTELLEYTSSGSLLIGALINSGQSRCLPLYSRLSANGVFYSVIHSLDKCNFRNSDVPFCKNSKILVMMKKPKYAVTDPLNQFVDGNSNATSFLWSNGLSSQSFITTVSDTLSISGKFLLQGQLCYSLPAFASFARKPDFLTLTGNNLNDQNKNEYAYKLITSTQKVINETEERYTSERAILLSPGFEVKPKAGIAFSAQIGGCVN